MLAGALAPTAAGVVAGGWALDHNQVSGAASRLVAAVVMVTVGWVIGTAVRQQRAYTAGLAEQAKRRAQAELEQGRRAVTEERRGSPANCTTWWHTA